MIVVFVNSNGIICGSGVKGSGPDSPFPKFLKKHMKIGQNHALTSTFLGWTSFLTPLFQSPNKYTHAIISSNRYSPLDLCQEWNAIPFDRLIRSKRRRCAVCINTRGGYIGYIDFVTYFFTICNCVRIICTYKKLEIIYFL